MTFALKSTLKTSLSILLLLVAGCINAQNKRIDYSKMSNWAAHPLIADASDWTNPSDSFYDVDVFFVQPTIYTQKKFKSYSASINDKKLRKSIQESTIKNQASVFNGLTNVYSPYYRQMHYDGYFEEDSVKKEQASAAFSVAYSDVLNAFNYFLKHYNNNKPFVLAAHSQGTNHSERLLKEVILINNDLKDRLVMAYLVGMPIQNSFTALPNCQNPNQTKCFVSWRTFNASFNPPIHGDTIVCSNPITFNNSNNWTTSSAHKGILFKSGKLKLKNAVSAKASNGCLSIKINKWPHKWIYNWDDYHAADYNLFWNNIRDNLGIRLEIYNKNKNQTNVSNVKKSNSN